jgi:hypothetical protein
MGHICRGSVILLLAGWVSAVHAQTAEQPVWKVGNKWSFKEDTSPPPAESTWTRVVREALPDGTFRVQTQTGELLIFDGETNSLDPRGPEYSWKRFSFPLSVGKEWSYKRSTGVAPNNGYENASWKVVAHERVTVPAGTFECFRVEGIVWQTFNTGLYGQFVAHQDVTYWYCPTVKWFARMKIHRYNNGRQTESESVLTSSIGDE